MSFFLSRRLSAGLVSHRLLSQRTLSQYRLSAVRSNGTSAHVSTSDINRPRSSRPFYTISVAVALSAVAYAVGAIYPPSTISMIFPRPAPPPLDPNSSAAVEYTNKLESELQSLPLLSAHRNQPDSSEWYELRPYDNFPEERRVNHLTAGVLRGPSKLALPPIARVKKDETEAWFIIHLGRALCGHDGIIHGGLLATLLDETLARTVSKIDDLGLL